jgi:hypothetical protein
MRWTAFALLLALLAGPAAAQDDSQNSSSTRHHAGGPAVQPEQPAATPFVADPSDHTERITGFDSDITVAKNGTLTVVESISVYAAHERINHGIFRDFPTIYTDKNGMRVKVRFDVVSVTMDGHDEPYTTEGISNGVRVKIGDKDTYVDEGSHAYVLTYTTARQIGFFDKYDELYWNVTGNGWVFTIDKVSATVHLPKGAEIRQFAFYTGPEGSDGKDATADRRSGDTIRFVTTQPLFAYSGLTIAVGFNKGVITPPTQEELREEFILDNASAMVALLGLMVLTIYYLTTWWHHGRDPKRGTIIPLFAPPAGLSPEAVRYIHRMAYDRKSFAAALINMAVRGYLKIGEDHHTYTLTRTGKSPADCGLSGSEIALGDALFTSATDSIELKQANHTRVQGAISSLQRSLKAECEVHYFITNSGYFWAGLGILLLTGIAAALLSDQAGGVGFGFAFLALLSAGASYLLHATWDRWRSVFRGPGSRIGNFVIALILTALSGGALAVLLLGIFIAGEMSSPLATATLVADGMLAYLFYHLLKAPTALGAQTLDQIDGFKMFLETAEKDRLEMLNPPQVTPEVFEKFLPYAIALDCENQWSRKFEREAAAAGLDPNQGYTPYWYTGSNFSSLGAAGFASSIGSSLGSAAASASVAPGSSSGSGGGGFSGGGGGGGGGGGW